MSLEKFHFMYGFLTCSFTFHSNLVKHYVALYIFLHLSPTKLIVLFAKVDVFYHRAVDILCSVWANPTTP